MSDIRTPPSLKWLLDRRARLLFNFIQHDVISNTVNKLFASYEDLNFLHVSWIYWHALCSPIHTRAAQLGAGIEALQNAFRKLSRKGYSTTLLDSQDAKSLREGFLKLVDALNIDAPLKQALVNKATKRSEAKRSEAKRKIRHRLV